MKCLLSFWFVPCVEHSPPRRRALYRPGVDWSVIGAHAHTNMSDFLKILLHAMCADMVRTPLPLSGNPGYTPVSRQVHTPIDGLPSTVRQ